MSALSAPRVPQTGELRLWTVQQEGAWVALRSSGVLRADGRHVWREFRPAYRWLMEQMHFRLGSPADRYPLWAWHRPKPDLRSSAHLPSGSRGVRIEFAVPSARVLLLDLDAWYAVLNAWHLSLTEAEDSWWEEKIRRRGADRNRLPPNLQTEMEASWQRVFDLSALNKSPWTGPVRYVQAVLEEIRLEEVLRVTPFVAR